MADDTDITKIGADGKPLIEDKTPVQLTKEQQEHVNTIFNSRFAKITSKYETQMATMQEELEALKAAPVKKDKDVDEDKSKADEDSPEKKQFKNLLEAEKNKAKLAEGEAKRAQDDAKAARQEALKIRKEVAIARAASKQNFYELDVVSNIVWDKVEYDDDLKTFVVKDNNGAIKQNSSLVNMTLEEYFNEFASQRPYLVNGDVKGGTSSTDNKGTLTGLIKSKKDLKTAKEKSDFISKFGLEKFEALEKE